MISIIKINLKSMSCIDRVAKVAYIIEPSGQGCMTGFSRTGGIHEHGASD